MTRPSSGRHSSGWRSSSALYERIGPTFEELLKEATPDETRPSIEFYRRHDEIDLLLPV